MALGQLFEEKSCALQKEHQRIQERIHGPTIGLRTRERRKGSKKRLEPSIA